MTAVSKTHFSASELAKMALPSLPTAAKNIIAKADREHWVAKRRNGKGGGLEYAITSLPQEAQTEIRRRQAQELLESSAASITLPEKGRSARREEQLNLTLTTVERLTSKQRAVAEARCALVGEVRKLSRVMGVKAAWQHVVDAAKHNALPFPLQQLVNVANARSNQERTFSVRSMSRWWTLFHSTESPSERLRRLAPQVREAEQAMPWWLGAFLAAYRRPGKPSLSEAYRDFAKAFPANEIVPSVHAVRRILKKLPPAALYVGRHTGAALKAKLPFVRRDWSQLQPGDVWVGDGHGLKAKVINPETGAPQVMEVTAVLDAASRMVTGWSVHLSENTLAVSDALRHGMTRWHRPLMYYSDNGAGETGKVLDADLTGILPRLGIHHETGIPGNAQGRGIIERLWQSTTLPLARKYGTYQGKSADRDSLRLVNRDISRALTAAKNAPEGTLVNIPHAPAFAQFIADLTEVFDEYNQTPHSSLPKRSGVHMTPAGYYAEFCPYTDDDRLCAAELDDLFRPTFTRTASRGEVRLWNNVYFSRELMEVDGQEVQVGVDIHDGSEVIVRDMQGRFVCRAAFEANKVAAFPVSLRDRLADERIKGKVGRARDKIAAAEAERNRALAAPSGDVLMPGFLNISRSQLAEKARAIQTVEVESEVVTKAAQQAAEEPAGWTVPADAPARWAEWQRLDRMTEAERIALGGKAARWFETYQTVAEWRAGQKQHLAA
ncbi:transposase [Laribacter hongkongensis]|uniref:Transposase n=5 Tax=Laribacter hongkongensis TaxID=168471 RepID=A0A248LI39_9NEIS|nr:transposase [Laribacter hongkongensis]